MSSNLKRQAITSAAIFLLAMMWNGILHLVVLADLNAQVAHLRRSDFSEKAWLSVIITAIISTLFVVAYRRCARSASIVEGAAIGLVFGIGIGTIVDLNQFIIYPIPFRVAAAWFVGGVCEFTLYGMVASLMMKRTVAHRHGA